MPRLFGTDGARGIANQDLSPELAFKLGEAGGLRLSPGAPGTFVVGRDTRRSGDLLEAALSAGLCTAGARVLRVGTLPTPAIAYLTKHLGADAGVVISASHNTAEYNGIKFFGPSGFKLSVAEEEGIEEVLFSEETHARPVGPGVGTVKDVRDAEEIYVEHAVSTIGGSLEGFRIVLDCANGAAYRVAPIIFRRLDADLEVLNADPDGLNINTGCGSTSIECVRAAVARGEAQIGLAYDGDADRVIAVDEVGEVVDGDFIMAICALQLKGNGRLSGDAVVATVMANLGFDIAMRQAGIKVYKTKVGDRYVLEEMLARDVVLGGEQSGHVIFLEHMPTGDGIITGLQLLDVMRETGRPLSDLKNVMRKLPQVLLNVAVRTKEIDGNRAINEALTIAEADLGDVGRILVRPSGTEPLVRVMVESESDETAGFVAGRVAAIIEKELG